jgi:GNAT superfamily N-acetyltransferase
VEIELLARSDERVGRLLARVPALSRGLLFGGDRWSPVEVVAIAHNDAGDDVGIATLAPRDEGGNPRPTIIGLWVDPAARRHGIGAALLVALAAESHRRYRAAAHVQAVTADGHRAIVAAQAAGAHLIAVDATAPGFQLP